MKPEEYTIAEHQHRLAAWAAGRAASVRGKNAFAVEAAKRWIETAALQKLIATPASIPDASEFDGKHKEWRMKIISAAKRDKNAPQVISHGTAAKLINTYLKVGVVCAGHHEKTKHLHPPIDRLLLNALTEHNVGSHKAIWRKYAMKGWSNFTSRDYQKVINTLKTLPELQTKGLWAVEYYWQGHQDAATKKQPNR